MRRLREKRRIWKGRILIYCVNCGVQLADSETRCPLCGTAVCHPEVKAGTDPKPYPPYESPIEEIRPGGAMFLVTMLFVLPVVITLLCDWRITGGITWSGYVAGALITVYLIAALPFWFRRPNPVIFVPTSFAAVALYVLYIDFATRGHWFLSFALPVLAATCLLVTAVVTLTRYVRKGYLYIFGGAFIASGGLAMLMEYLINLTFYIHRTFFWSIYPLAAGFLIGMTLIVIAICKPLRESLRKKFFF